MKRQEEAELFNSPTGEEEGLNVMTATLDVMAELGSKYGCDFQQDSAAGRVLAAEIANPPHVWV